MTERERKERQNGTRKEDGESNKMIVICQSVSENSTGAYQLHAAQIQSYPRLKYMLFLWSREETNGEEGNGGQAQRLIHLMPQCCLARLPFVAQNAGQRRKADTKNRQDSLQDTLVPSPLTGGRTKQSAAWTPR